MGLACSTLDREDENLREEEQDIEERIILK
jgi:hypothetical protein